MFLKFSLKHEVLLYFHTLHVVTDNAYLDIISDTLIAHLYVSRDVHALMFTSRLSVRGQRRRPVRVNRTGETDV